MMDTVHQAIDQLPKILQGPLTSDWEAFVAAGGHEGLLPRTLEQLVRVWGASPQTAKYCLRESSRLKAWQSDEGGLKAIDYERYAVRFAEALLQAESKDQLKSILRTIRNQEMLRIAWRDITGDAELNETLAALSTLADAMLQSALDWLSVRHAERFGHARTSDGEIQQLVVIGMGKLGGQELNFSSDIDLIFAYQAPGMTDGSRTISNEDYFRRLAQDLAAALNEPTADGFVFRVDTRLRPFGTSGPMAMHFSAMEQYYQSHGREWERYAWIKARPVAGDLLAGEALLNMLRPFIYRRYLDYGAFDAMREMKALIEQQIKRKGLEHNIKLGAGGIREIEFIVQVFQLIHGGRHLELRNRQLRVVLPALVEHGFISADSAQQLDEAYVFLRQLENRIQAYADQQTHELPDSDHGHAAMALAMGYPDWHEAVTTVNAYRADVHDQFERVFSAPQTTTVAEDPQAELMALWRETLPEDSAQNLLKSEGYAAPDKILESLDRFREGIRYRAVGEKSRRRLDSCVVMLIAAAAGQSEADQVLERLLLVLREIAGRSSYIALLVENPLALSQLVRLCAASPWIAAQLSESPMLLDSLLDIRQLYSPPLRHALQEELADLVGQAPVEDIEQQMNLLRRFKQTAVLRVAAADVSGAMPLMVVSDRLTEIAEVVVEHALQAAWAQTTARHGQPRMANGELAGLLVISYGKFGGFELGYGSDLDLVFVHDGEADGVTDGDRSISHEAFFTRLGQRIIHWLNTYTPAGRAYEVDMRLRPNGQSGLLVTSLDALDLYQNERAWIWEHQALVRARPVAGKKILADRFHRMRHQVLAKPRDVAELRQSVLDMREKMRSSLETKEAGQFDLKQGVGGIADIEFIVQFNVLCWVGEFPQLAEYTDNIRILEHLGASHLWAQKDAEALCEAYRTLRRGMHSRALQELPALSEEGTQREARDVVRQCWQRYLEEVT